MVTSTSSDSDSADIDQWAKRLCELGFAVQARVARLNSVHHPVPVEPVAEESGDVIYPIDREVEPIITDTINSWSIELGPIALIAEGIGDDGYTFFGHSRTTPPRFRIIVDPIDGTRGLMYDKRSGWFLAAVAPDRGEATSLSDTIAAVIVELPTTKQCWADHFVASTVQPTLGWRRSLRNQEQHALNICPSSALNLNNGFAHVANYFPRTKVLAAELMEYIVRHSSRGIAPENVHVFDDQYISTAGQMVDLMMGRDRFCCDVRPLLFDIIERTTGHMRRTLECHPYDIAGAFVAARAGVILTDGFGRNLDSVLSVYQPIHWCGYANSSLQQLIQPLVTEWFRDHGLTCS